MIAYQFLFKWPSTIWTPHGRAKDVLKVTVYQFPFDCDNTCLKTLWTSKRYPQIGRLPVRIWLAQNQFEHHRDVQKKSSKWSSTSSYLTDTTSVWTPHGRPKDVLKGIVYQFLFDWHNQFEHPMDVQKMSSKWSSTSSNLSDTKPVWTPHGRPKDVLKVIVYQFLFKWPSTIWTPLGRPKDVLKGIVYHFLFDLHKPFLNTSWTCVRCPESDRLPVPTWLIQNLFE